MSDQGLDDSIASAFARMVGRVGDDKIERVPGLQSCQRITHNGERLRHVLPRGRDGDGIGIQEGDVDGGLNR